MKTYYTISEVSMTFNIPQSKIRYFCTMHSEFLNPKRGTQNKRKFTTHDNRMLVKIYVLSRVMNHVGINECLQGKIKIEFL